MAGKKVPSMEDQIKIFKNVIFRASGKPISEIKFYFINRILITNIEIKNKKYYLIFNIELDLWKEISQDDEIHMSELDIKNIDNKDIIRKISIIINTNPDSWISIDAVDIYNGKVIKIRPDNYEYDISINKNLLPLKMKKSEYTDISYTIFNNGISLIFALKKEFKYPLENSGFSIMRLFQVM